MNKELYKKNINLLEEYQTLRYTVNSLKKFLEEHEKNFERKKSIESLKKIRAYLELKQKDYQECSDNQKNTFKELRNTCSHEVAVKGYCISQYKCLICGYPFSLSGRVPDESLISIDVSKDIEVQKMLDEIYKEVISSDQDLIEIISEKIEDWQYERNIKVYRRSK